jgi:aryl-alcohol dehydrogenase-like predicted oxidoreductase
MAEVSLAWQLGRPGVAAPIVGATKPRHLEAALRALDVTLSDEERTALDVTLTPEEIGTLETPYRAHAIKGY